MVAEDLGRGLDELRLLGIAGLELVENFLRVAHASSNDGKRKNVGRGTLCTANFIEYG